VQIPTYNQQESPTGAPDAVFVSEALRRFPNRIPAKDQTAKAMSRAGKVALDIGTQMKEAYDAKLLADEQILTSQKHEVLKSQMESPEWRKNNHWTTWSDYNHDANKAIIDAIESDFKGGRLAKQAAVRDAMEQKLKSTSRVNTWSRNEQVKEAKFDTEEKKKHYVQSGVSAFVDATTNPDIALAYGSMDASMKATIGYEAFLASQVQSGILSPEAAINHMKDMQNQVKSGIWEWRIDDKPERAVVELTDLQKQYLDIVADKSLNKEKKSEKLEDIGLSLEQIVSLKATAIKVIAARKRSSRVNGNAENASIKAEVAQMREEEEYLLWEKLYAASNIKDKTARFEALDAVEQEVIVSTKKRHEGYRLLAPDKRNSFIKEIRDRKAGKFINDDFFALDHVNNLLKTSLDTAREIVLDYQRAGRLTNKTSNGILATIANQSVKNGWSFIDSSLNPKNVPSLEFSSILTLKAAHPLAEKDYYNRIAEAGAKLAPGESISREDADKISEAVVSDWLPQDIKDEIESIRAQKTTRQETREAVENRVKSNPYEKSKRELSKKLKSDLVLAQENAETDEEFIIARDAAIKNFYIQLKKLESKNNEKGTEE